ncbi:MAG: purine-nucleoside phosphorylase [Patescibacteria group bacterium]|nr:purine-nucleoside phosphorylase [Patescibacteria group bacterium]
MNKSQKLISKKISESIAFIKKNIALKIDFSIILGSGFEPDNKLFKEKIVIPYEKIPNFVKPVIKTHKGLLRFGTLGGKNVLIFHGRIHAYQGYNAQEVAYNARVAAKISKQGVIFTNLVGGINQKHKVGDFIILKDHINLTDFNPLIMSDENLGSYFVDMTNAYKKEWNKKLIAIAKKEKIKANEGIFAFLIGPNFETPAELSLLKKIGADIVGWSIVPEVLAARQANTNIAAISCVSDITSLKGKSKINLDKIWNVGKIKSEYLFKLINKFILTF